MNSKWISHSWNIRVSVSYCIYEFNILTIWKYEFNACTKTQIITGPDIAKKQRQATQFFDFYYFVRVALYMYLSNYNRYNETFIAKNDNYVQACWTHTSMLSLKYCFHRHLVLLYTVCCTLYDCILVICVVRLLSSCMVHTYNPHLLNVIIWEFII